MLGDNSIVSDFDIAIFADELSSIDKVLLYADIEEIHTF